MTGADGVCGRDGCGRRAWSRGRWREAVAKTLAGGGSREDAVVGTAGDGACCKPYEIPKAVHVDKFLAWLSGGDVSSIDVPQLSIGLVIDASGWPVLVKKCEFLGCGVLLSPLLP